MRAKIGICSAIALILGANSAPFLLFDFSKTASLSLRPNPAGGGSSSRLNPFNWKNNSLKISENSASHLNLKQKSPNLNVESLKLDNSKEIDSNLLSLKEVTSSEEDRKNISSLSTEINKEAYSLEIKKEVESSLSASLKKIKDSKDTFKKVVEESRNAESQKNSRNRSRRASSELSIVENTDRKINFPERQSVSTFYREFSDLKGKSQEFKRRLEEEIIKGKKPTKKTISNSAEEALKSLDTIGWNKNGRINFQKFINHRWWDQGNPYAHIIDFQEWETLKQMYQGAELTIKAVKGKGSNRFCSATVGLIFHISESFCYKDAQEPQRIKKRIEDLMPIQVLDKLLKDMNLIKKQEV